jgi:hypothetical protein
VSQASFDKNTFDDNLMLVSNKSFHLKVHSQSTELLLHEFSNITVNINVKENWGHDIDNPIIDEELGEVIEYPKIWDFTLIFNRDFSVDGNSPKDFAQDINLDYNKFIDEERLNTYQEIDKVVISKDPLLKKRNYLSSIKSRFAELLSNYYNLTDNKYSKYFGLIDNKFINRVTSEQKMVNHFFEKKLVHSFLIVQKNSIQALLQFIDEKLLLLSEQVNSVVLNPNNKIKTLTNIDIKDERYSGVKVEKRTLPTKSFQLNPKIYKSDSINVDSVIAEKLKEFKDALLKYGFIKPIDLRDFMQVFKNQEVKNPIQWDSDPKELSYLMKALYDLELIVRFKNYWQICCRCFIAYRKKNIVCTPPYLQRCKPKIRGLQKLKIDSVIDTLK